jgi:hypothetical protein
MVDVLMVKYLDKILVGNIRAVVSEVYDGWSCRWLCRKV